MSPADTRTVGQGLPSGTSRALAQPSSAAAVAHQDPGDLGVHLAAATVVERCPHPLSELEVAVVLETCGYNASRARSAGASDLMELARAVYQLVPVYAGSEDPGGRSRAATATSRWWLAWATARSFTRGLLLAAPLLISISTILVAGVSFWSSSVELPAVAGSVTLSSCLALVCTGPFVYAFLNRGSFYLAFGDAGILAYITRRTLGLGMLVTSLACLMAYLLRTATGAAGPHAVNQLGLASGIAIGALQVGLAPLYLRSAVGAMTLVVGAGAGLLIWHVSHLGSFIDPVALTVWQVRLVAAMAAATWLLSGWWLLRRGGAGASGKAPAPQRLWLPSGTAVARAVAPYAVFGLGYFCLVTLPQLVAGGAWRWTYVFNGRYAIASGMSLVPLVPVAAFGNVSVEHLTRRALQRALSQARIGAVESARARMQRQWLSHAALAAVASAAVVTTVDLVLPHFARGWLMAHGMEAVPALLYPCSAGYFFLSVGTFAAQSLFAVSSKTGPVMAAVAGTLAMAAFGALATISSVPWGTAAAGGFCLGTGVFALMAVHAGHKAYGLVDFTCYRGL